jgi:hypothetical protein
MPGPRQRSTCVCVRGALWSWPWPWRGRAHMHTVTSRRFTTDDAPFRPFPCPHHFIFSHARYALARRATRRVIKNVLELYIFHTHTHILRTSGKATKTVQSVACSAQTMTIKSSTKGTKGAKEEDQKTPVILISQSRQRAARHAHSTHENNTTLVTGGVKGLTSPLHDATHYSYTYTNTSMFTHRTPFYVFKTCLRL